MRIKLEYTDTFGGEANYSYVDRQILDISDAEASERRIKYLAKGCFGLTGIQGTWTNYGNMLEFKPRGMCVVLFVVFD